jgi:hypothetical protein
MLFKAALLQRIADGTVTLAFRQWHRPSVRTGGTLRTAAGVLMIDAVEPVRIVDLTTEDALRSGFASVAALVDSVPARSGARLYRIALHRLGEDPRDALRKDDRLDSADVADLLDRLGRLDRQGSWTAAALRLIGRRDGTTAGEIAAALAFDKAVVKRRIRQLKEIGLTESLQSGYRLSPRGRAALEHLPDH